MTVDPMKACSDFIKKTGADPVLFASSVNDVATAEVRKICRVSNGRDRLVLLLTTPGGDADAAFRIARAFRRRYKQITVIINGECKSAGTLIALCADELVMTDTGELGPLDVQLQRATEIAGPPQSGLDLTQALRVLEENMLSSFRAHVLDIRMGSKLSTKLACELACRLATGAYRSIYEQIDPIRLGEVQRKIVIANEYGERLASDNVREGAVTALVAQYPSHGFVIDREEAEELFHKVRTPDADEVALIEALPPFMFELQFDKTYVVRLEPPNAKNSTTAATTPTTSSNPGPTGPAPGAPSASPGASGPGGAQCDAGAPGD